MAHLLRWLQQHFWVPMLAALLAGMLVPDLGHELSWTFKPAILIILTLVFTRIDMAEVLGHIRAPWLLAYLVLLKLIVVPLLLYAALQSWLPSLAVGVLLLTAAPPAAAAPVFTELVKGNTTLCVSFYLLCYLVAPVTITFVMGFTGLAELDLWGLFRSTALLVFAPLILAQLAKKLIPTFIERTQTHYGSLNLIVITYLVFAVVSASARDFRENVGFMVGVAALLTVLFLLLHLIGYLMVIWRPEADRLAISVSLTYMNTALTVVLAIEFFAPEVLLVAVASEIPWSTMLGPARWLHRKWRPAKDEPAQAT